MDPNKIKPTYSFKAHSLSGLGGSSFKLGTQASASSKPSSTASQGQPPSQSQSQPPAPPSPAIGASILAAEAANGPRDVVMKESDERNGPTLAQPRPSLDSAAAAAIAPSTSTSAGPTPAGSSTDFNGTISLSQIHLQPPPPPPAPTPLAVVPKTAATVASSALASTSAFKAAVPDDLDELDESDLSSLDDVPLANRAGCSGSAKPSPGPLAAVKKERKVRRKTTSTGGNAAAILNNKAKSVPLPHYDVVKGNGTKDSPHRIVIRPGVTDANSENWPTELTIGNITAGARLWYQEDEKRNSMCKYQAGMELAELLGLRKNTADGKAVEWTLDDWPEGYKYLIHYSGTAAKLRTDPYIFGTYFPRRFRTAREITPHLYWLLQNGPGEGQSLPCACKYDSGSTQMEVNRTVGLGGVELKRESSVASESPRPAKKPKVAVEASPLGKEEKKEKEKEKEKEIDPLKEKEKKEKKEKEKEKQKKLQRQSLPKPVSAGGPSTSTSTSTSTATTNLAAAAAKRPAREKSLSPPTYSGAYSAPDRERDLREGPMFRMHELVYARLPNVLLDPDVVFPVRGPLEIDWWPAVIVSRTTAPESKKVISADGKMTFVNKPAFKYRVRFLALAEQDEQLVEENRIRPWLSYSPPNELISPARFTSPKSVKLVWTGEKCWRPKIKMLENAGVASTTFALAIQIAAHIVAGFALVDRYAISMRHLQLAPNVTPAEKLAIDQHLKNWHFQSLWWGAEKIWSGELVRLMADADVFQGSTPIMNASDPQEVRLFFKITSVYKDLSKGDEEQAAAKVVGQLYELVDSSLVKNGKMKDSMTNDDDGYFPPPPTPEYAFRRHGPADGDLHLELEYVAGRYYPPPERLRSKAAIAEVLAKDEEDTSRLGENAPLSEDMRYLTLAGIVPAYRLYMKCHVWNEDRAQVMKTSESTAHEEMGRYLKAATA